MTICCTRRRLLYMAGVLAAREPLRLIAGPLAPSKAAGVSQPADGTRLYAIRRNARGAGIGVFVVRNGVRELRQWVPAPQVRQVLVNPAGDLLYATYGAEKAGLPAGWVEAFSIDRQSGQLTPAQRQRLALSARDPQALAVSPDGRMLAVLAANGVFSLLPVRASGEVGEVSSAHKHLALAMVPPAKMQMSFQGVARLDLRCGTQSWQYECSEGGLTFTGVREAAQPLKVEDAAHAAARDETEPLHQPRAD